MILFLANNDGECFFDLSRARLLNEIGGLVIISTYTAGIDVSHI